MVALVAQADQPRGDVPPLRGRRVLLVDDDPILLRAWTRTLERHGLIVRAVSTIAQAREALALWPRRKFDYALVDDRLPDGFGLDLVGKLSELRPAPGFAVVSGLPSTERALRAWQSANVIVPKPSSPDGLIELLGFLDTHRKARRLRYKRSTHVFEPIEFGVYVLETEGLNGPHGSFRLTAVARSLLAKLVEHEGAWVPTVQLARELYQIDDAHGTMLVRRQISLLRRALGNERWIVESALQRGYRIAPAALRGEAMSDVTTEVSS